MQVSVLQKTAACCCSEKTLVMQRTTNDAKRLTENTDGCRSYFEVQPILHSSLAAENQSKLSVNHILAGKDSRLGELLLRCCCNTGRSTSFTCDFQQKHPD